MSNSHPFPSFEQRSESEECPCYINYIELNLAGKYPWHGTCIIPNMESAQPLQRPKSFDIITSLSSLSHGENRRTHHFYPESGVRLLFWLRIREKSVYGTFICRWKSMRGASVYLLHAAAEREKEIEFASLAAGEMRAASLFFSPLAATAARPVQMSWSVKCTPRQAGSRARNPPSDATARHPCGQIALLQLLILRANLHPKSILI